MSKSLRLLTLIATGLLVFSACGNDDAGNPPEDNVAPQAAASSEEFCNSIVEAETAVLAASSGGDTSEIEGLVANAVNTAPDEISDQVDFVAAAVDKALTKKDDSAFGSDAFQKNEEEVDRWVVDNCGFESIDVTAVDYAFEGVPQTIPAGKVNITLSNEGNEVHEMLMVRFKDDATTIEDLLKLSDRQAEQKIEFIGASFGPPGATDSEAKNLEPGRYALVCFVSVGSTDLKAAEKADGPPHVAKGMSAEFTVE